MKKDFTELVFILDRSGSMGGLESDTIGGFNSMIEKQKNLEGEVILTTVLFDDKYELLHDRINLQAIKPITGEDYYVRGSTALLDAIGYTIQKIDNIHNRTSKDYRADKVLFFITTDGLENASREYSYDKVKKMVTEKKEKDEWEFIFIGANIDAISTAKQFGVPSDRAVNYRADKKGTELNYAAMNSAAESFRSGKKIDENWKDELDEDFKNRK